MFIYNDLEQAGGIIQNFETGRDVLDIRDLMLIAGQDANLEIRESDTGAEIWISHADSGDFILTTLENVEASMLTAGQDIWM